VEAGASYQFLGILRPAFGTGETFLIFTDLHEAFKDMLAGAAFKFIDGHGKFLLFNFAKKLTHSLVIGQEGFRNQKNPGGAFPPGF
jgi:hypothetical protein